MPKMNGVELCRHLRGYERHEHTPIIMCSSAFENLDMQALRQELGLITFVLKPINCIGSA
jgi:CheY-like chemotaxis protein